MEFLPRLWHNLRIHHNLAHWRSEKDWNVRFGTLTPEFTSGALKFGFGCYFFVLLFKILMVTLGDFSVYFVVSKLLILASFGLQITNERIFKKMLAF